MTSTSHWAFQSHREAIVSRVEHHHQTAPIKMSSRKSNKKMYNYQLLKVFIREELRQSLPQAFAQNKTSVYYQICYRTIIIVKLVNLKFRWVMHQLLYRSTKTDLKSLGKFRSDNVWYHKQTQIFWQIYAKISVVKLKYHRKHKIWH